MRRLFLVLTVLVLCQGCFVLDEIDKGQELLDKYGGAEKREEQKKAEQAKKAPSRTAAGGSDEQGVLERLTGWWEKRSQPRRPESDPDDVIVHCRVGGQLRFMRESECLLRGGAGT